MRGAVVGVRIFARSIPSPQRLSVDLLCTYSSPDFVPSNRSVPGPSAKLRGKSVSRIHESGFCSPQKSVYVVTPSSCTVAAFVSKPYNAWCSSLTPSPYAAYSTYACDDASPQRLPVSGAVSRKEDGHGGRTLSPGRGHTEAHGD